MAVGVLSLQGAVREHLETLRRIGVEAITVRTPEEVAAVEGLILPGGESTTIGKLMVRYGLQQPIQELVASGRPLLGTCAGMILMAKTIQDGIVDQPRLAVMDITVQRNAFGRQVDSFETDLEFDGIEGGRPGRCSFEHRSLPESGTGWKCSPLTTERRWRRARGTCWCSPSIRS